MANMKILLILLLSININARLTPKRIKIYECVDQRDDTMVDRVFLYSSTLGQKHFYEAEVWPNKVLYPKLKSKWYRLNLSTMYNNHVLTFARGRFRIKIQKTLPVEHKYKASAYIPDFQIHTSKWYCKEYKTN